MTPHATQTALPAVHGYSHVRTAHGRLVVVSGQLPIDAAGILVGQDAQTQARQVFGHLRVALAAGGATFEDVIRLGYFLIDLRDLPAVRRVRDEFVAAAATPPASTLVAVSALVVSGARLEVDALAVVA